jgi:hypothetical protein
VVLYRLNHAGRTLLALRAKGLSPNGVGAAWPDIVQNLWEAHNPDAPRINQLRSFVPSPTDIDRMDEAYCWISHIPLSAGLPGSGELYSRHGGAVLRRIVLMRSLVSPVTDRHCWSWRRMSEVFGASHEALRRWHSQAIDTIVDGMRISH